MPDLAPWDYELLKASIARVGVLVPVLKDEYGNTIDGYQRERACRELPRERGLGT
jgi:ParB-like chromosome segregation protein Spo0J